MAASIEDELIAKIKKKFRISDLTEKQIQSISALRDAKDVFVSTRTGSGKSLSYECAPLLFEDSSVLILAPLTSIMIEQCEKLTSLGFKATYVGKNNEERKLIADGHFDFLFTSPENIVGNPVWRDTITSDSFKRKLRLIAVDEAQTVLQWGEGKDDEDPFRVWFSRIGELRSLFTNIPLLALTATASPLSRRKIMRKLGFRSNREVIIDSSDRRNIKITALSTSASKPIPQVFEWLFHGLEEKKKEFPRHLVFCSTINECSRIYADFISYFGRGYELVNMYHSKTNEAVKQEIRDDMNIDSGKIRILICTNAAGMGLNFKAVNNIVHFGLPREMDTFVQQMGRAGRDGSFAHELILLRMNKIHFKHSEPDLVRFARDKTICRHKLLCDSYLCTHEPITPPHNCCDICAAKCECGEEICSYSHPACESASANIKDADQLERCVTECDKDLLKQQLKSLQFSLLSDECRSETLIDIVSVSDLSDSLIDSVILHCSKIFTPVDVMLHTTCWSYMVASEISSLVNLVFGDTDMYEYLEVLSDNSDH